MKRYPKYKLSGLDWIGEVPDHWQSSKLKHYAKIITGCTPSTNVDEYFSEDDGAPWVKPGDLNEFIPITTSKQKLTDKGLTQTRLVRKGSVLVGGIGDIGKFGFAGCELTTNQQIHSIEGNKSKINDDFLKYLIFNSIEELQKNSTSVVLAILTKTKLMDLGIIIPSLSEQLQISSFLDRQTAEIDRVIATREKQIELLNELRTSVISNAVTKGIDSNAKMKPSGVEWIGEMPKHWDVIKLKYVAKIVNGSTPSSSAEEFWDGDIVWVTPADMNTNKYLNDSKRKITTSGLKSCGTTLVPRGSIILSSRAPIGKVAVSDTELCTNQGCKSLLVNAKVDNQFLYYYLLCMSDVLNNLGSGTTFLEISTSKLSIFEISIPPLFEQKRIVIYIENKLNEVFSAIDKYNQQIELLKSYKTSLISEVVTGKIDVREQSNN